MWVGPATLERDGAMRRRWLNYGSRPKWFHDIYFVAAGTYRAGFRMRAPFSMQNAGVSFEAHRHSRVARSVVSRDDGSVSG
jgi:hypothetical protein